MRIIFAGLSGLFQIPLFAVWLAGIVIAALRWSRHPRVSLLAVLGITLVGVEAIVGSLLLPQAVVGSIVFPRAAQFLSPSTSPGAVGLVLAILSAVDRLIRAVGWGLILAAVFMDRDSTTG